MADEYTSLPEATPIIQVEYPVKCCWEGWEPVIETIQESIRRVRRKKVVVVVECHPGIYESNILEALTAGIPFGTIAETADLFKDEVEVRKMTSRYLSEKNHLGRMSSLEINDFFDEGKRGALESNLREVSEGTVLIFGLGASIVHSPDILIYADLSRYEMQQRFRRSDISNVGVQNRFDHFGEQYLWSFFIDWHASDLIKKSVVKKCDYFLDTNNWKRPRMALGDAVRKALKRTASRPFFQAPFFDPALWDGSSKDISSDDFHCYFNCVQEENSVLYQFDDTLFEVPAINAVFYQPRDLLGETVYRRFGSELPIRFDFIDSLDEQAPSVQVYPETEYISDHFGVRCFQDESYYVMDAKPNASVHIGLLPKKKASKKFNKALNTKNAEIGRFSLDKHLVNLPLKKHEHLPVKPGIAHSNGSGAMILRISSAPQIFSFKLWEKEWTLSDEQRKIHLREGLEVLLPELQANANASILIAEGEGWTAEKLGGHASEFIGKIRHRFTQAVEHETHDTVNVVNLVEGDKVVVESPLDEFPPLVVHYPKVIR